MEGPGDYSANEEIAMATQTFTDSPSGAEQHANHSTDMQSRMGQRIKDTHDTSECIASTGTQQFSDNSLKMPMFDLAGWHTSASSAIISKIKACSRSTLPGFLLASPLPKSLESKTQMQLASLVDLHHRRWCPTIQTR